MLCIFDSTFYIHHFFELLVFRYSSMSKEEKLHKQEELEKFEDNSYSVSRPLSHNRKLRDYKIDNLKSETDETSECDISAKPSTSSTE